MRYQFSGKRKLRRVESRRRDRKMGKSSKTNETRDNTMPVRE